MGAFGCWFYYRDELDEKTRRRMASRLFKKLYPTFKKPKPSRYINTWSSNLWDYGTLLTPTAPGPKPKLPKSAVRRAINLLYEGWENEGKRLAYTSINEALQHSPGLRAILSRYKVKEDSLLRRMKELLPSVKKRLLFFKRQLTPEQQEARLQAVTRLLKDWPLEKLRRVFWVDASTIIIKPRGIKVYLPPGHRALVFTDDRLQRHSSKIQKLKFYICVNAILGPVALVFTTGTTDMEPTGNWQVSLLALPALQCLSWGGGWGGTMLHACLSHPAALRVGG